MAYFVFFLLQERRVVAAAAAAGTGWNGARSDRKTGEHHAAHISAAVRLPLRHSAVRRRRVLRAPAEEEVGAAVSNRSASKAAPRRVSTVPASSSRALSLAGCVWSGRLSAAAARRVGAACRPGGEDAAILADRRGQISGCAEEAARLTSGDGADGE